MKASNIKRLKELGETPRYEQMYADLSLKAHTNAGRYNKKAIQSVSKRRVWAQELQAQYDVGIAVRCQVIWMIRTTYYYKPKLSNDSEIIDILSELTEKHARWGFLKCFKRIRELS